MCQAQGLDNAAVYFRFSLRLGVGGVLFTQTLANELNVYTVF